MTEEDTKVEKFEVRVSDLETKKSKKSIYIGITVSTIFIVVVAIIAITLSSKNDEKDDDRKIIKLPAPKKSGGLPLNEALSIRQTKREFNETGKLTSEELSQLLWACYGINRPENEHKTVPSSKGVFPFDVYVFMKTGVYLYDPLKHELILNKAGDLRNATGLDDYVPNAYANICLFGLYSREDYEDMETKRLKMELDSGFATQNMYFVAASEGFNSCVRANFNLKTLLDAIGFSIDEYYVPLCYSAGR